MNKQLNPNWEPPVADPREAGLRDWDTLRQELMVTRDALRASQVDCEAYARRIDDLTKDLARSKALEAEAVREQISYKTSIEDMGRLCLGILQRGIVARKNGDPYAPPAIPNVDIEKTSNEIEDVLKAAAPTFLNRNNISQSEYGELMNEMLERVARAIENRDFMGESEVGSLEAKELARVAIEAMREPTGKMVTAGANEGQWAEGMPRGAIGERKYRLDAALDVYQAMIDAAIKTNE